MRRGKFVRMRTGIVGLLVFALAAAPAVPVLAGRGFFQRRAPRSYGASGAVGGSWGSHGATGGGRVVYTQPAVQHRTVGSYASHGAAGGTPHGYAVASSRPVQVHYPTNRVVVRRSPQVVHPQAPTVVANPIVMPRPVFNTIDRVPTSPMIAKRQSTLPAPTRTVVPPAPKSDVLDHIAYSDTELPFSETISGQSIARVESQRHVVMKPNMNDDTEPAVLAGLSDRDLQRHDSRPQLTVKPAVETEDLETKDLQAATSTSSEFKQENADSANEPELAATDQQESATQPTPTTDQEQTSSPGLESLTQRPEATEPGQSKPSELPEPTSVQPNSSDDLASLLDVSAPDENDLVSTSQPTEQEEDASDSDANSDPSSLPTPSEAGMSSILVKHNKRNEVEKERDTAKSKPQRARLVLHVPAAAEVYLMNRKMVTMGPTRLFNVPVSDPDKLHSYHIRVKMPSGQVVESTQMIRAGQLLELTIADEAGNLAVMPPQISAFD